MEMKDVLSKDLMKFELQATTKEGAIKELIQVMADGGKLIDKDAYEKAVFEREASFSTGIGFNVAIPHAKTDAVKEPAIVFAKSTNGVDFDSADKNPAHLFFLIAIPSAQAGDVHVKLLSQISRKLMHQSVRDELMKANTYEDVLAIFQN